jgi:GNAT superfamily N-acetyltransferase
MNVLPNLRKLTPADVPTAFALSTEAGWNQTPEEWRLLLEIAPDGCFGIEVDDELVSTASLVNYGRELAWIGMVLTRESFRGRGLAKRLLSELIRTADESGIRCVKLDATEQGQPLYEQLGFRSEQTVERWHTSSPLIPATPQPFVGLSPRALDTDRRAFGVDRTTLLHRLATSSQLFATDGSFVMTRPGRLCNYLGPCVADEPATARTLIAGALEESREWYWDLLPANTSAVAIAREFGFSPKRRLLRMVRGAELRGDERNIYALAGFELG